MADVLAYGLLLIALIVAAGFIYIRVTEARKLRGLRHKSQVTL